MISLYCRDEQRLRETLILPLAHVQRSLEQMCLQAMLSRQSSMARVAAAAEQVRTMAKAFAAVPARILWKLTPGEAEALDGWGLGSNIKVGSVVFGRVAPG